MRVLLGLWLCLVSLPGQGSRWQDPHLRAAEDYVRQKQLPRAFGRGTNRSTANSNRLLFMTSPHPRNPARHGVVRLMFAPVRAAQGNALQTRGTYLLRCPD